MTLRLSTEHFQVHIRNFSCSSLLNLDFYDDPSKKQVQHLLQHVSKQTLQVPALLRFIPKFPLFPAMVDDKALENSSQEPEAQSSLILSLIREPFLKLKHKNTP